jgi:hypothetical protein
MTAALELGQLVTELVRERNAEHDVTSASMFAGVRRDTRGVARGAAEHVAHVGCRHGKARSATRRAVPLYAAHADGEHRSERR